MPRLSIGYIVDHPKRDLPGAVQFAHALLGRGCNAYIIPLYDQANDVPLLPLDALIVNFARPANFDLVRAYHAMGLPVWVMDTEGGNHTVAGSNTPSRLAQLLRERGFSPLLAGHFFWGQALRNEFALQCGMAENQLVATGCPRFDYASARWAGLLQPPHEPGYVLVNSNYSLINPRFSKSLDVERAAMVSAGWQADYVNQLIGDLQRAFTSFAEATVALAASLPNQRFVYRPHPFENHDFYRGRFAQVPNVVVDGEGSVLAAIAHSSCVVHLNCATAVESMMLGKLPISLEYLNTQTLLQHAPLPSQISLHAKSFEHAAQCVSDPSLASANFDFRGLYDRYVLPWFHCNDGAAADRMADVLLTAVTPRRLRRSLKAIVTGGRTQVSLGQLVQGCMAAGLGSWLTSRVRARIQVRRQDKLYDAKVIQAALAELACHEHSRSPLVRQARHPWTGFPLSSVLCSLDD
jgi:surface carbohydrate biosynthesis protein